MSAVQLRPGIVPVQTGCIVRQTSYRGLLVDFTEDFLLTSCTLLACPVIVGRTHGLGTMDLPETRLRALAAEAGFSSVRRLPLENPFNTLYQLKPSPGARNPVFPFPLPDGMRREITTCGHN